MPQTLYDFGGAPDAPVLHLALANGFPPQTYRALLTPFTDTCHVLCLPPRALWSGSHAPEETRSWTQLGDDLLAGMAQHGLTDVVAVGHSFGGIASALAALREPERFRALVLLDPTLLDERILWLIRASRWFNFEHRQPLVQGALRRKAAFASKEEAFGYFRGKRLFADWSDAVLRDYADSLVPAPEGGFRLAWAPEWEARYFQTYAVESWNRLAKLRSSPVPVLVMRGGTSDTLTAAGGARLRRLLPRAAYHEIPGHGHLFPHSAPEQTRAVMAAWLRALPPR